MVRSAEKQTPSAAARPSATASLRADSPAEVVERRREANSQSCSAPQPPPPRQAERSQRTGKAQRNEALVQQRPSATAFVPGPKTVRSDVEKQTHSPAARPFATASAAFAPGQRQSATGKGTKKRNPCPAALLSLRTRSEVGWGRRRES